MIIKKQISNQNKSILAAYTFLKRSYLKYPSQVLCERSSSVRKESNSPFMLKDLTTTIKK